MIGVNSREGFTTSSFWSITPKKYTVPAGLRWSEALYGNIVANFTFIGSFPKMAGKHKNIESISLKKSRSSHK